MGRRGAAQISYEDVYRIHSIRVTCRPPRNPERPLHCRVRFYRFLTMGASTSKAAGRTAAGARKFPTTPSSSVLKSSTPKPPPPPRRSNPPASDQKSPHIDLDARDPHFGAALRKVGASHIVSPDPQRSNAFPTSSQPPPGQQPNQKIFPSESNPSLLVLRAREQVGQRWEEEQENLGRSSFAGRTLMGAKELKGVLEMRDRGGGDRSGIERRFGLREGLVGRLGGSGVVENA